jgi:hypothetical protein
MSSSKTDWFIIFTRRIIALNRGGITTMTECARCCGGVPRTQRRFGVGLAKIKKYGSHPRTMQLTTNWCGMWKVYIVEEYEKLLADPFKRQKRITEYKDENPDYQDTHFVVTYTGDGFDEKVSHAMEDWLLENKLAYIRPYVGQFEFWDADTAMQFMLRWGGADV